MQWLHTQQTFCKRQHASTSHTCAPSPSADAAVTVPIYERHTSYASSLFTICEISPPSALPAICFEATPMTLPISFIDVAPT